MAETSLADYSTLLSTNLNEFLKSCSALGVTELAEVGSLVRGRLTQLSFLTTTASYSKPSDSELAKLLQPTSDSITNILKYREQRRSSPYFNHLSAISESIPALGWVAIAPTPCPHIKEMTDAGVFYTNRVLKEWKEKPGHSEWVKTWLATLAALHAYVKKNHTTGVVWGKGGPPPSSNGSRGAAPPPPPPPSFDLGMEALSMGGADESRAALFAELNKGEGVTSGLKRVTDDMKVYKNPGLKSSGVVPSAVAGGGGQPPATTTQVKPPKFSLEGKKWVIENQVKNQEVLVKSPEMSQVVYAFNCKDSIIKVQGKVNSIVLDSCHKTAVVFDSVVSSAEFINCRDCQMQVMVSVPTITIDKVDGLQIYLNRESLNVEIVSAKSSALNVMVPTGGNQGDYSELPVPEQYKTTVVGGKLVTIPTELVGV